jgi:GNAT superfamily N-acetyltransferase
MNDNLNISMDDWRIFCDNGCLEYELDSDKTAVVMAINVHRKRTGTGTALLQSFEQMAQSEGCNLISVPVSLSSEAISFWLSMGYKLANKQDKRKMDKILKSDYYCSRNDSQGILTMEKVFN